VTEHAAAADISEPTARPMNQLGLLLKSKALYAQAEPLYRPVERPKLALPGHSFR
jgi:hypothetical protein